MSSRFFVVAGAAGALFLSACGGAEVEVAPVGPQPVVAVATVAPLANGTLIRGEVVGNLHKYWIILNGTRHASELKTVQALGLNPDAAREQTPGDLAIPEGVPMHTDFSISKLIPQEMTKIQNRTIVRSPDSPNVYLIVSGQRHLISNPGLLQGLAIEAGVSLLTITPEQMAQIPEGPHW